MPCNYSVILTTSGAGVLCLSSCARSSCKLAPERHCCYSPCSRNIQSSSSRWWTVINKSGKLLVGPTVWVGSLSTPRAQVGSTISYHLMPACGIPAESSKELCCLLCPHHSSSHHRSAACFLETACFNGLTSVGEEISGLGEQSRYLSGNRRS